MRKFGRTKQRAPDQARQLDPPPVYLDARVVLADRFLFGEGLEIGPLHQPLAIPQHARARYVDRMKTEDLQREYPELADWNLTEVDVVDDGESLATVPAASQDFIIANHFLEHCEDPIGTIETHLAKLNPGGVLFYAVPDKRYTFDFRRPVTPLEHMVADHEQGPERSRSEHYREWATLVDETPDTDGETPEEWAVRRARELEDAKYSIHMHVWTQAEFLKLVLELRERSGDAFDIEVAARSAIEFIVVLRKAGPLPAPASGSPQPGRRPSALAALRWRGRQALSAARGRFRRWRARP